MSRTDKALRRILSEVRVIACLGASPNPMRPSNYVSRFLLDRGYRVIPVNPGIAGQQLFGEVAVASLHDISEPVDMVDIFRRADRVEAAVHEAIDAMPGLRCVWMQLGVGTAAAIGLAEEHGYEVVAERCPMIEIPRLFGSATRAQYGVGTA